MVRPAPETGTLTGTALVEQGYLTGDQLDKILNLPAGQKQRIGETAVTLGFITDRDLARFLSDHFQVPYLPLGEEDGAIDSCAAELIPQKIALRYHVIVAKKESGVVTLAMADPLDVRAVDAVRLETRCRVKKTVSPKNAILQAIERYYHAPSKLAQSLDTLLAVETCAGASPEQAKEDAPLLDKLKIEASDVPVVQFVNLVLMRAVQERASDIHIEPEEQSASVRFRIDGTLRETSAPPKHMLQAITTRIKLLSNLDIAERRLPQDGRFKFTVFEKEIDVRVSCLPLIHGEKIVMRILDRSSLILDMRALGFDEDILRVFDRTLRLPHGLILLTGPTGSGKTTTLYAALNGIKDSTKNVVTIEDPVEYQLSKVNQVHTKADIGFTFGAGLRSILRQDPDIIMVGEMRDRETADICIRASLTGHLVLSTLHTNDSVSAVSRLKDMGIEPYLLASTLNLVMAQRLVRCVCQNCAAPWKPSSDILLRLDRLAEEDTSKWNFSKGAGCENCGRSGYRGRIAVYEALRVSEEVRNLIADGAPLSALREAARKEGLKTLLEGALARVREGVTTPEEAFRICATQEEMTR